MNKHLPFGRVNFKNHACRQWEVYQVSWIIQVPRTIQGAAELSLTNFKCLHTLADEASAIIVPGRVPAPTGWAREGTSSDRARGPSPTLDAHTPCDTLIACTFSRSIVPKVVARRCSKRSGHALRSSRTCLSPTTKLRARRVCQCQRDPQSSTISNQAWGSSA
jgi:hypothetical protein